MQIVQETRALAQIDSDVLVVGIFQDDDIATTLRTIDPTISDSFATSLKEVARIEKFSGKSSQSLQAATFGQIAAKKLVLKGLGQKSEITAQVVRKAAADARKKCGNSTSAAVAFGFGTEAFAVQSAIEGWILGGYKFNKYKTKQEDQDESSEVSEFKLVAPGLNESQFAEAARRGAAIAGATNYARDLVAEPPAYMTPTRLAEAAQASAVGANFKVEVLEAADARALGMGAFLGVAQGALEPPKFIVVRYSHPKARRTVGLAGKGITFDSGGLSIKPAQGMENMKYDMSGAAAVIGAVRALADLNPAINVIAVAVATENMPSDRAMHPGDVITAMNGKTIEVNNTDAEGRLVLADALCYLVKEKVDEIIDLATLTGAVVTALGRAAAGIMSNNEALVQRIIESGNSAGEKYWQLPMFDEYKETLKSEIADLKNAGARGEAPTCSAAMFLKEFVDTVPWAHLDIAGPAWLEKGKDELNKGGTAFGVRTLCYYLLMQSEL